MLIYCLYFQTKKYICQKKYFYIEKLNVCTNYVQLKAYKYVIIEISVLNNIEFDVTLNKFNQPTEIFAFTDLNISKKITKRIFSYDFIQRSHRNIMFLIYLMRGFVLLKINYSISRLNWKRNDKIHNSLMNGI